MKILGIDTTAGVASVAVVENGKILSSFTLDSGNTHSTTLLPMIEASLNALGLKISDVGLFSVAAGPGSFTGVRIGCATVKGLAFAEETPTVGVSSLEAMAENLSDLDGVICPVVNARRNRVYTALFEAKAGKIKRLTEDCVAEAETLPEMLGKYDSDVYFTGDAYDFAKKYAASDRVKETPSSLRRPLGEGVALLGERKFREATGAQREKMTPENLAVIYLGKTQAEREREERLAAEKDTGETK